MKTKALIPALVILVLTWSFSASFASVSFIIDTTNSDGSAWHGITEGPGPCDGFGQTFIAPVENPFLISFSFWMNDYLNPDRHEDLTDVDTYVDFGAYLMEWDPVNEKAVGTVLWQSVMQTTTNPGGMEEFTFDTGGILLQPGVQYIIFVSTTDYYDGLPGGASMATYFESDTGNRNGYLDGYSVAQIEGSYINGTWSVQPYGSDASTRIVFNGIQNAPPLAEAGPDQVVVDRITLDASDSYDSDGSIVSYDWSVWRRTIVEGYPRLVTASGESPLVIDLAPGFYDVTLIVTDNEGSTGTDTMLLGVSGTQPWDVNGDGATGLEEVIHTLQDLSGVRPE